MGIQGLERTAREEMLNFEDFCEYILPYRVGDEPLSLWRKELYDKYNPLLDKSANQLIAMI